jgi:5'-nucleotidase
MRGTPPGLLLVSSLFVFAGAAAAPPPVHVKILGFNDFHGQLPPTHAKGKAAGGAVALTSYLEAARKGFEDRYLVVHAGDLVGASPPASALLEDEPAVAMLNGLANTRCRRGADDERCNVVATMGNHELDEGSAEMMRLQHGGNHAQGPFLEDPWKGAVYPTVLANVVHRESGKPLFPSWVVRRLGGVRVGVIGAVLKETPSIVVPAGITDLVFSDEAAAINRSVAELQKQGVHAIVVLLHQGGSQPVYEGPTRTDAPPPRGEILRIVAQLDDDVDLVVSGHSHQFTNALLPSRGKRPILVVQAWSRGTGFDDVDLEIDPRSGDVVKRSARVVSTWVQGAPAPDPAIQSLVARASARVAPLADRVVGRAAEDILREANAAGESSLGDLVADAQRRAGSTEVALMNPGGIRDDLRAGPITWGELFTIQPFGNDLMKMRLTGQQLRDVLEQQWLGQTTPRLLAVSGLRYTWDDKATAGARVRSVEIGGKSLEPGRVYTVTVNAFLAGGGDGFTALAQAAETTPCENDLDALVEHVRALPQPLRPRIEGRVRVE